MRTDGLYCPIRKRIVSALPEEQVRVRLLHEMIHLLGFPQGGIVIEKELSQMPHLATSSEPLPCRRADIVCFAPGIHPEHSLYPLLLIECKAVEITPKVMNQVIGYNHFVKAYFIAVVNQEKCQVGWFDRNAKTYRYVDYLPTYANLLAKISRPQ